MPRSCTILALQPAPLRGSCPRPGAGAPVLQQPSAAQPVPVFLVVAGAFLVHRWGLRLEDAAGLFRHGGDLHGPFLAGGRAGGRRTVTVGRRPVGPAAVQSVPALGRELQAALPPSAEAGGYPGPLAIVGNQQEWDSLRPERSGA